MAAQFKEADAFYSKKGNKFFIDREDDGNEIFSPGDAVTWTYNLKEYRGVVSNRAVGRDDDMFELDVIPF